jgi:hypothetical protein
MAMRKVSTGTIIAIAATGLFLTILTSALLLSSQTVPSTGTVLSTVEVGVYNDQACTQNCTSIDWSTLGPGSSTTKTVYVKNTGTLPMALNMATTDWNPSDADGPITLGWNREGAVLNASQSINATLTLSVSPSINSSITTFSFNITITGTES